jgi:hypothetical protein
MSKQRYVRSAAVAVLLVLAASCGGTAEPGATGGATVTTAGASPATASPAAPATPPADGDQGDEEVSSRLEPAAVSLRTSGAATVDWQEAVGLRIVTVLPEERALRLLSVGIEDFKDLGNGRWVRFAFDLVGAYEGPGEYTIPAEGGPADPNDSAGLTNTFVHIARPADSARPLAADNIAGADEYTRPLEACAIVIGEDVRSGSLTCPSLADGDGQTISLHLVWEPDSD